MKRVYSFLTKKLMIGVLLLLIITGTGLAQAPIGWGIVNTLGVNGITGGGNNNAVTVTSRQELQSAAGKYEPLTIFVKGTLTGPGTVNIRSNKTIIGLGDDATLDGIGLDVRGHSNIIIRNLTIKDTKGAPDAIATRESHHIWIDHCDLSNASDGLLDITQGSDYVTVSWTEFSNHDKVSLVNSGTNNFIDHEKNRVTYYNNWFHNTVQRNPRVGYGKVHIFNNYYSDISSYAIGVHTRALVLAENNYFLNTRNPFEQNYSNNEWDANYGDLEVIGNIFDNSSGRKTGTGKSFNPSLYYDYAFALVAGEQVPQIVKSQVGPGVEFEHLLIPVPGNGLVDLATSSKLAWVDTRQVSSWEVYLGTDTDLAFQEMVTEPEFIPEELLPEQTYYWRVDAITESGTVEGELWRFSTAKQTASKPFPVDGQTQTQPYIVTNFNSTRPLELKWVPGFGASAYDVYLGTSPNLEAADYLGQVTKTLMAPGRLQQGNTYYWRVDAITDEQIVTGDTWSFYLPGLLIGAGRTEAENMVLGGRYFLEYHAPGPSNYIKPSNDWLVKIEAGPGTISAVWADPDAQCNLSVAYLDQSAGRGRFAVYVDDTLVHNWTADVNNNLINVVEIPNVKLKTGDEIRIEGISNSGMLSRVDYIEIKVLDEED